MPVIQEIKNVVEELVKRVVLSETYNETFHPDAHPLYAPLGYQEKMKKRVREANDIFFKNKRVRSDSMDTNYNSYSDHEDQLEDVVKQIEDEIVYSEDVLTGDEVIYSEDEVHEMEAMKDKIIYSEDVKPHDIYINVDTFEYQKKTKGAHPLEGIIPQKEIHLWEDESSEWSPFKRFMKPSKTKNMEDLIYVYDDGRVMFTSTYVL